MIAADSHHAWSGQELLDREDWRIDAAPAIERDLDALLAWTGERSDPLATLEASSQELPGFDALATRARAALGVNGPGVAWIRGLPTDPEAARLAYLAIGCRLGDPLENYLKREGSGEVGPVAVSESDGEDSGEEPD